MGATSDNKTIPGVHRFFILLASVYAILGFDVASAQTFHRGPDGMQCMSFARDIPSVKENSPTRQTPGPEPESGSVTSSPVLQNAGEFMERLISILGDEQSRHRAEVRVLVDTRGAVPQACIHSGSGNAAFDEAVIRTSAMSRFIPAHRDDQPVVTWAAFPVTYGPP